MDRPRFIVAFETSFLARARTECTVARVRKSLPRSFSLRCKISFARRFSSNRVRGF